MLALGVPLALAHLLARPELVWVGLGGFLLTVGDSTDDGDRAQPLRILVGIVLGSLALASGILAGATLATAMTGMVVWAVVTGMMAVYGNAFAAMAMPIAWAYAALGLSATDHSLAHAVATAAQFGAGGMVALALALTLSFGGPFAPVRAQTAACYRALAAYLDAPADAVEPPEAVVRAAIAEARRRAGEARQAAAGPSRLNQRALALIELADRLYGAIGALRETGEPAPAGMRAALLAVAAMAERRGSVDELRRLRAALPPGGGMFGARVVETLSHALAVAAHDEVPELPGAEPSTTTRLAALLGPLRANFDRNSVIARHALRFAVVSAVAVVVFWFYPGPFGYWVPLTVTVVLKPSVGLTVLRSIQRALGTALGVLVGVALMPLLPTLPLQFAAVCLLFFAMMTVLTFNYSLAVVLLSAALIPFEHLLQPDLHAAIGPDRLIATAVGAALALVGGHLLWPTFERQALPDLLRASVATTAAYADAVLGAVAGDPAASDRHAARRAAGLALSNLQAGLQRALNEIGADPAAMSAMLRAATALQQLSLTLNALRQAAPTLAATHPPIAAFRTALVAALAHGGPPPAPPATTDTSPEAAFLAQSLARLSSSLQTLHAARA